MTTKQARMVMVAALFVGAGCGSKGAGGGTDGGSGGSGPVGGTDGMTSTSGGLSGGASGPGGASTGPGGTTGGGDGSTGSTGGTGGFPADEGRCPGWTEEVLAEACAAAEGGSPTVATRAIYAVFDVDHEFGGPAQLIRVPLTEVPEEDRPGLEEVGLRLKFSNGPQQDVMRALAVFSVDNVLEAGFTTNIGFVSGAKIDTSSCMELSGGRAMEAVANLPPMEEVDFSLVPDGQPSDSIPWDQDVHFVVVTRPPECMGMAAEPAAPRALELPPGAEAQALQASELGPHPCGGG